MNRYFSAKSSIRADASFLAHVPRDQWRLVRSFTSTRPAIWSVEKAGIRAIVKDFGSNRFLYRNTVGRFLIWRESKAYRRLAHLKGVPAFYGVLNGITLVLEQIEAESLENLEHKYRLDPDFFSKLKHLVYQVHKRGVAHCDLKRAPNILVTKDGFPLIIDWGASIFFREFRFFPLNRIYRRFLLDDFMAVTKFKIRHVPEAVSERERKWYSHRSRWEQMIRDIRDRIRSLIQRLA